MHFRYTKNLGSAKAYGIRKGLASGAGMGFFFFVIFGTYALAFWYGGKLVREEDYTPGRMLTVSISSFSKSLMLGVSAGVSCSDVGSLVAVIS